MSAIPNPRSPININNMTGHSMEQKQTRIHVKLSAMEII